VLCINNADKLLEIFTKKLAISKRISAISFTKQQRLISVTIDQNLG
jgi:hypothetical protein